MKTPALRVALASAFLLVFASACGEPDPVCGDNVQAGAEECDDGNEDGTDSCVQCRNARCGDSQVQTGVEACDDGNTDETDDCRFNCTLPTCGDGIKQATEACDSGALGGETCQSLGLGGGELACNTLCTDFVTSACCGDGVIGGDELCDGSAVGSATCGDQGLGEGTLSCNATCDAYDVTACCGDGTIGGDETCDGAALGDNTCQTEGLGAGALACNATCNGFETAACCGDGTIGGDEVCDGDDLAGATCESEGHSSGALACSATCDAYETSNCCGDGAVGSSETCDGANLAGQSCESQGFISGNLSCAASCGGFETAACCGDGVRAATEVCDSAQLNGETCETQGFPRGGTLACGTCDGFRVGGCCGDGTVAAGEACDDGNAVDGDGCDNTCTLSAAAPQNVFVCPQRALAPLPQGVCAVTAGNSAKLITGNILLPGQVLRGGQVAVDAAGQITCVGCDCAAQAVGATEITCPQGAVSPGLINAHDHITYAQNPPMPTSERYEHRHDWREGLRGHTAIDTSGGASTAQVRWGELRYLLGGATSVIGSGSATGFLRNLDRADGLEGLAQSPVRYQTFPLDDSFQLRDGDCDYGSAPDTEATIASVAAYFPHIGEGIDREARNEFFCTAFSTFDTVPAGTAPSGLSHDLIEAKTAVIHAVGFKAPDFGQMGVEGSSMVWSPRSNVSLYGDTAQVSVAARMGVNIALGTDWMPSGSMNMLRELKCASDWNQERLDGYFSDEDLWKMVTVNGAKAAQMDDALGVLAVGRVADLAIFDARVRTDYSAVVHGELQDVALVMRGGKPLSGDAVLIDALSTGCDTLAVCGVDKRVCVQSEIGSSLAQLQSAAGNIYGAVFCGTPTDEPTCVPERPISVKGSTVYTGALTPDDDDGDGILDVTDNCPALFNPIRPQDSGIQADFDGDGEGDVCDVCPLNPGTTTCTAFDPNDSDADGVPNTTDLCPVTPDPMQLDNDTDGKGDACDACPNDANPGAEACPASIYDIKTGVLPQGQAVSLPSAVVTARYSDGYFLQVETSDPSYTGPDFSGIFVFDSTPVEPGTRISIQLATIGSFQGQLQLAGLSGVSVLATGVPLPAPVLATAAELQTGGSRAAALEGVLVRVEDVTVTSLTPTAGAGDSLPTREFEVDGSDASTDALLVNDLLFLIDPFPTLGEQFLSLTGVLSFRYGNSKLEPRSVADVVAAAPGLLELTPSSSFSREGYTDAPTFPAVITVQLTRTTGANLFVPVTSDAAGVLTVTGGGVTVPAGGNSAVLTVTGVSPGTATLTGSLGGVDRVATVQVLAAAAQPALSALLPSAAVVLSGGTVQLSVQLDIPAPPGGTTVPLAATGGGTVPASVTVPSDALTASFTFTDSGTGQPSSIDATLGAVTLNASVVVADRRLVINEVDYDQASTDSAEFVELYNGTASAVDLTNLAVVFVNGNGDSEYRRVSLASAGSLPAGGYLVVGPSTVAIDPGAIRVVLSGTNLIQNGSPDGLALINTATLEVLDALSYTGSITAGVLSGFAAPVTLVEGTATSAVDTVGGSLIRYPNGVDTDNASYDWSLAGAPSPGAANTP